MLNSRDISLLRSDVAANCRTFVALCKSAGFPVLVTNTVRDAEYQEYLYAQGRTRPGSIVTNGKRPTFHWDKAGLAFDICKNVKGQEYSDPAFWRGVSAIGKKVGFTWGGDWKSFVDKPHFQWDAHGKYTNSMILAGKMPPTMPLYKEDEMGEEQFYQMFLQAMARYVKEQNKQPVGKTFAASWAKAKAAGVTDGSAPAAPLTRQQAAAMFDRMGQLDK